MSPTRALPRVLLFAALALAGACASTPKVAPADDVAVDTASGTTVALPRARRNANVITREELADPSLSGASGLDAVRRLRPTFLASRGAISLRDPNAGTVKVSLDGGTLGPLEDLDRIRTNEIRAIRYLSASDATQRFGVSAGGSPVILVDRL